VSSDENTHKHSIPICGGNSRVFGKENVLLLLGCIVTLAYNIMACDRREGSSVQTRGNTTWDQKSLFDGEANLSYKLNSQRDLMIIYSKVRRVEHNTR
jgi:hypothetical protein